MNKAQNIAVERVVESLKESAQALQQKGLISESTNCEWAAYYLETFREVINAGLGQPVGKWPPRAIVDVLAERQRQDQIWGEQNHPPLMWFSIIGEEYGEMCKEYNEYSFDKHPSHLYNMKRETVQVAASCVAMLECLERQGERGIPHE